MGTSTTVLREVLESLAYVAQIVAVGVLIYAACSYLLQRQQLNFDVVTNCTARFQGVLPGLYSDDESQRREAQSKYVDLCNEELFYFLNGYPESGEHGPAPISTFFQSAQCPRGTLVRETSF